MPRKLKASPPPAHAAAPTRPRRRTLELVLFLLLALAVASALQFCTPRVAETDVFYHLFYASQYAARGPLTTLSPHVVHSVLRPFPGDIWYGFHLLVAPFTFVPDGLLRLKLAGVWVLTCALVILYFAFRRSRVVLPFLWPFVTLFSFGMTTWRFAMVRPHVISVALSVALLALFAEGSLPALVAVSAAVSLVHVNYFWVPLVVVVIAAFAHHLTSDAWPWKKLAAVAGGLAIGALLRPHPISALRVLYVQLFRTMLERGPAHLGAPLELRPADPGEFALMSPVFLLVALFVLFLVLRATRSLKKRSAQRDQVLLWASLSLSLLFLLMTLFLAQRTIELCAPFAALFLASAVTALQQRARRPLGNRLLLAGPLGNRLLLAGGLVFLAALVAFSFPWYQQKMATAGVSPARLRPAAVWLRANARPDDTVFNLITDSFGELTYWGAPTQFLQGQDTFFLYADDPQLFYEAAHLGMGILPGKTWRTETPLQGQEIDAATALTEDFKARYFLITKPELAPLGQVFDQDPALRRCFESEHADLYVASTR